MAELQGESRRRYVAEMFGRIAPRYDLMNTVMTGGMHHRWRKLAARIATRDMTGLALDIGTGTGDLAFALARHPGITGVVGLDLVPAMMRFSHGKDGHRPHLVVGDGLSLPFGDDVFGCAASGFVLRNMPDVEAALAEMVRVVKPGGRVVVLEIVPGRLGPVRPLFRLYFHRVVPTVGRIISGDGPAYSYLPQSVDRFPSRQALSGMLAKTGLRDVRCRGVGLGTVAIFSGAKG